MAQRPAAPTLSPAPDNNKLAYLEFDVPTTGAPTHAMVYVHDDVTDRTLMYDGQAQKLLLNGERGKLLTLEENGRTPRRKRLTVAGLWAGTFTATVAFRAADDLEFGPTSPRSAPLVRALPPAPGAPILEAVSDTKVMVHFAVPHGCSSAAVEFYEDESSSGRSVDPQTRTLRELDGTGPPFAVTGDRIVLVEGLSSEISYSVKVYAHNGIGWGPASPASKPLKLADHQPPAPGAPVLERISADSVRVFCRLSPKCTHADVLFEDMDTRVELSVDAQGGNKLRESGEGVPPPRGDCYKGIVVPGLSPGTEYEVYYKQFSNFGWSDYSPYARLPPDSGGDDAPVVVPSPPPAGALNTTPAPAHPPPAPDALRFLAQPMAQTLAPAASAASASTTKTTPPPPPPSDEDEAGAAPAAIARHLPPVATWPARSPRPEADDDDAAPVPAPSPPPDPAPAPAPADDRKRAVDADDTDDDAPPPASRPIKKEKRKSAHGYDCTDGFCVADGDEDEPARAARTATEAIFGEPDSDEGDQDDAAEQAAKRRKESPPGWARAPL